MWGREALSVGRARLFPSPLSAPPTDSGLPPSLPPHHLVFSLPLLSPPPPRKNLTNDPFLLPLRTYSKALKGSSAGLFALGFEAPSSFTSSSSSTLLIPPLLALLCTAIMPPLRLLFSHRGRISCSLPSIRNVCQVLLKPFFPPGKVMHTFAQRSMEAFGAKKFLPKRCLQDFFFAALLSVPSRQAHGPLHRSHGVKENGLWRGLGATHS